MTPTIEVTYVLSGDARLTVTTPADVSLMEAAQKNGVPGILAECGGACACATCHVYVDETFLPLLPEPGEYENDMLDNVAAGRRPNSRLSCQVRLAPQLSGLVVVVPEQM